MFSCFCFSYFFSTFDDDSLLCFLDDEVDNEIDEEVEVEDENQNITTLSAK